MGSAKTVNIVTSQMDIVQMVSDIISLTSGNLDAVLIITCVESVLYLWPVCAMVPCSPTLSCVSHLGTEQEHIRRLEKGPTVHIHTDKA